MIDGTISFEEIATQMQKAITLWESGLKTTGGAIVPEGIGTNQNHTVNTKHQWYHHILKVKV